MRGEAATRLPETDQLQVSLEIKLRRNAALQALLRSALNAHCTSDWRTVIRASKYDW